MNSNANLSPLPFYGSIAEQGFRLKYAYGQNWPLIAPVNRFLPFQLRHDTDTQIALLDVSITISNVPGTITRDVTDLFRLGGLQVKNYDGYAMIIFPANVDMNIWEQYGLDFNNDFALEDFGGAYTEGLSCGYIIVTVNGITNYYSEVMTLARDESGLVKLEWMSLKNIVFRGGMIVYEELRFEYVNRLYFRTEVGMPEYRSEEETEERDGFSFPTFQSSEKVYRFGFTATEPVCDVLRLVGMADVVKVTDTLGRVYFADKFVPQVTWNPQGYVADVSCEFETDTVVVQACRAIDPSPRIYNATTMEDLSGGRVVFASQAEEGESVYLRVEPNLLVASYSMSNNFGGDLTITTNPATPGVFLVHAAKNMGESSRTSLITFKTVIGDSVDVTIIQSS